MAIPKTMKAVKVLGPGQADIQDAPVPEPQSHEVLVHVSCVALNPIDWQIGLPKLPVAGSTLGCDFAGTVAALGSSPRKAFAVGERVCGWVVGNNIVRKDNGGFAEYLVIDAELCVRVPKGLADTEVATIGASIATAGMGVFMKHGIPLPGAEGGDEGATASGETMLIYGGTSATGALAIQMAKLAGINPVTTCASRAIDRVKTLGATAAFDYRDPDCGEAIKSHTHNTLTKVFDTISTAASLPICLAALADTNGNPKTISTTLPWPSDLPKKEGVEDSMLFTFTIFGVDTGYGESILPASRNDYAYAKRLYALAETWLVEGKLKPHPPEVCGSTPGLEGVFEAIEVASKGGISGMKLVVEL